MAAKGKRKAKATSPERKSKRVSATGISSDASNSEYAGEEDVGRDESEGMLAIAEMAKRFTKEDPFFEELRQDIAADEIELQKLVDDKETEISDRNLSFDAHLRALLTTTLSTSTHAAKARVQVDKRGRVVSTESEKTPAPNDAHPGFDHSNILFAKSENLLRLYEGAERGISRFKGVGETKAEWEAERAEVARLILIGEEMTKRQIEGVLQRSEEKEPATPRGKRSRSRGRSGTPGQRVGTPHKQEVERLFNEDDVKEAGAIFGELRERRVGQAVEDGLMEEEEGLAGEREVAAVYPLLRGIEKGAKRMIRHLPMDEDMYEA